MSRPVSLATGLVLTAALCLVAAPGWAQDPAPRGGAGTNLPGGGGGGNASNPGSSSTAVSRGDAGGWSGSTGGNASGGAGGGSWSGGGGSGSAVVGPGAAGSRRFGIDRRTGATGGSSTPGGSDTAARVTPWYSRSRGDRPAVGTAAGREGYSRPGYSRDGVDYSSYYYNRDYYYGYYGLNFYPCGMYGYGGYGLGAFYYDPAWAIGYRGCYGAHPYSWQYGYGGYAGYLRPDYWGGASYGAATGAATGYMNAAVKLKVKPSSAEVFVDGYFAGVVDEFDGTFQRLPLTPGEHRIEIRAAGFEGLSFVINAEAYEVINYRAELQRR